MATGHNPARALLAVLFLASSAHGQFMRGMGELYYKDIASDYMFRFRVAVTPKSNVIYAIIAPLDRIGAFLYSTSSRGLGQPFWVSEPLPGLNASQPVLSVDSAASSSGYNSSSSSGATDRVYLLRPQDGRIACFDAGAAAANATATGGMGGGGGGGEGAAGAPAVWVSSEVCYAPGGERAQHLQALAANGRRLLARCNESVVLLDARGVLLKTFGGEAIRSFVANGDLAARIPTYDNFTRMVTWAAAPASDGDAAGDDDPDAAAAAAAAAPASLAVWSLAGAAPAKLTTAPGASIALPEGVRVGGVNTDAVWWAVVTDASRPLLHLLHSYTGKLHCSYDFTPLVDPDGALSELVVVPTPVLYGGRMLYGLVRGVEPSPFPWLPEQYPDKHYWWMFALNATDTKQPALLWLTPRQNTRGRIANQSPWMTSVAAFMTDFPQNGTRSFDRRTGEPYFNMPADPYSKAKSTTYSLVRGTYKISLPWATPNGGSVLVQYDDWEADAVPPEERGGVSMGWMRAVRGLPYSPPSPPRPPSPPPQRPPAPEAGGQ